MKYPPVSLRSLESLLLGYYITLGIKIIIINYLLQYYYLYPIPYSFHCLYILIILNHEVKGLVSAKRLSLNI